MKFAKLILLTAAIVDARHHHHHKHISLAQGEGDAPAVTPASNRATFEAARRNAAQVVATQQGFEAKKTADVAARNAANTQATHKLKSHVRRARHH